MMRQGGRPARRGGPPARAQVLALALALLATAVAAGGASAPLTDAATRFAAVGDTTTAIRVRNGPNRDAAVILKLPKGVRLTITGKPEDGHYPIAWGAIQGWAPTGSVETPDRTRTLARPDRRAVRAQQRVVAAGKLNVRAGPDAEAPVIAGLDRGDEADLTGEERDGFLEVRVDGEAGWVLGRYLSGPQSAPATESLRRADIIAIIHEAADRYGQSREDMLRVARCESDLVSQAVNSVGGSYGLFQFKPFTWDSTPYAEYDIFDPRANAYAAAWMWSVGRRNEWVCQ